MHYLGVNLSFEGDQPWWPECRPPEITYHLGSLHFGIEAIWN
jgi:hypothetical protein